MLLLFTRQGSVILRPFTPGTGASIAPVFNLGPQIVGQILGLPYGQYRPKNSDAPIVQPNLLGDLNAWITADEKGMGTRAPKYAKPVWYGMFDPTLTQVGDYLVGPLGTFFVSSQNAPQSFQLVLCNHTVTITQPAIQTSFGAQPYGGDTLATEITLATSWPCSMLQGTKGEQGTSRLPGDVKQPWDIILLPPIPGVNLRNNFIATDETGQRHIMSSTELSALGWRITAALATT